MTVTYNEYNDEKRKFFTKHRHDFKCDTSPMDEYGRYWKTYVFKDGAQWCEAMSPVEETIETKTIVHNIELVFKNDVKFMRVEYWTTEFGSKYYYEKW